MGVAERTRVRLLEAALRRIAAEGPEGLRMREVAEEAGCAVGLAYRYFPGRSGLILAWYEELAARLEEGEIPEGTVAERFAGVARRKLQMLAERPAVARALLAAGLDAQGSAGVLSPETARVRLRVQAVFAAAVAGACDAPPEGEQAATARLLYALHLGLVLAFAQAAEADRAAIVGEGVEVAAGLAGLAAAGRRMPWVEGLIGRVDGLIGRLMRAPQGAAGRTEAVIALLARRLRLRAGAEREKAELGLRAVWGGRIAAALAGEGPIRLVLPGFPARSPSPRKVLGPLPDLAEWLAIAGLREFCAQIAALHAPGVELVLCADGHVFAEVVGVDDAACDQYRAALERIVAEQARLRPLPGVRLRMFDLRDALGGDLAGAALRARLIEGYAEPVEAFEAALAEGPELRATVDGVHRFLIEDAGGPQGPEARQQRKQAGESRTALRKRQRAAAREVVRRSRAWARLIGRAFPEAIRLSIHPQAPLSEKIGIYLLADGADHPEDPWLTPWHACALLGPDRARLIHRAEAERLGARLVEVDGRPDHFELP